MDKLYGAGTEYGREIQNCGGETETRILGRHRSKCVIILKWKKYKMRRDWVHIIQDKTGDEL